ncbi:MAG TPA: bifunctional acetate--CoA ligase family protein/GNAT family N-acetyltransferase, partial [Candidatus Acidoferrales bacterium]|nr:bifunctional acetate--CoA ligase family protein/GNAT family N-acetyltransferase [Candidatus Acidoferrales bacterium]
MMPHIGMNATFAQAIARPGNVAFLSQSGALCTAILGWSFVEQVGFSTFVSTGSMLDIGWGDLIDYFGDDPHTKSILIYMESVGEARSFLSAAREVSLSKPVIVLKAGRSEAASKAAASHTGALTGSDDVLEAAFRRVGVLRVNAISDLFHLADALSKQPRPQGPKLAILTNAGGPGVLATDAVIASGGELAALTPQTIEALSGFLPPHWSRGNPVDVLGDADAERYEHALEVVLADPTSDGLLVALTPQGMTDPTEIAERVTHHAKQSSKPLLASWMGGQDVAGGAAALNAASIPTFAYPDTAARVFELMWRYTYNLRGIYETPVVAEEPEKVAGERVKAQAMLSAARASGRTLLTEYESKQLLALYGIPTLETRIARSADEAAEAASQIGYPAVVKLHSETVTHKTDVGGVKLNLPDADAVRKAFAEIQTSVEAKAGPGHFLGVTVQPMSRATGYELILGSATDAQFGPVIVFGSGGEFVEVYRDRALALPPLNSTLAQRMMEQTKIFRAFRGVRGRRPVDLAALELALIRFSRLVVENPVIQESDVNPLVAGPESVLALDARFALHPKDVADADLPKPAIRPYPIQYVSPWVTKTGTPVVIRPIRPEDETLMPDFHKAISERSVYFRYFHAAKLDQRVAHERLIRMCFLDYDREMALLANRTDPATGKHEILGIGRMSKLHGTNSAEVALIVRDQVQRQGIGMEIVRRLIQVARDEHLSTLVAYMLQENIEMQGLLRRAGFHITASEDPAIVLA